MRIADDGEIQFSGPTVFRGYWQRPEPRPPRRSPTTAGTGPATSATSTPAGRLILSGRIKDIIVLPNGFNVYPEDIENALRIAGIRDSVVLETQPGPDRGGRPRRAATSAAARRTRSGEGAPTVIEADPAAVRARIDAAVKAANATLGAEPADRRLAAVARGGLPADPHAQDQARPGPRLGGRRAALPVRQAAGRGP